MWAFSMKTATTTQVLPAAINLDLIANISLPYEQKEEQSSTELPMEQAGRASTRTGDFSYCQRKHQARCIIVYSISYLLSFCRNSTVFYKWKRLSFFFHWASSANPLEQRHAFRVSNKHKKFPKTVPISKSLLSNGNKITNSSLYVFFWRRSRIALAVTEIACKCACGSAMAQSASLLHRQFC